MNLKHINTLTEELTLTSVPALPICPELYTEKLQLLLESTISCCQGKLWVDKLGNKLQTLDFIFLLV